MQSHLYSGKVLPATWLLVLALELAECSYAQPAAPTSLQDRQARVLEIAGLVEVTRAGSQRWDPGYTNQFLYAGDQLRTGERSRAAVRLSSLKMVRLGELSHLQLPPETGERAGFSLLRGFLHFLHRDKPEAFQVWTPTVSAMIRGTDFSLEVAADGTTRLCVLEGQVQMSNQFGLLILGSGEEGKAEPGKRLHKTALLSTVNVVQWCLYYPAVLDASELEWDDAERSQLTESLKRYRQGDLLQALENYPAGREPVSAEDKAYLAALLLAVGQVGKAEVLLGEADLQHERASRLANALRTLIAAVKSQTRVSEAPLSAASMRLASEWLAASYDYQSRSDLTNALRAAQEAVQRSPQFGFGWARVADLEFSFGRTSASEKALDRSLWLAPRNAQALALKGFLLSSRNRINEAIACFDQALAIDGALGNAWLGRGLCRIRQGEREAGREDLQVAALVEPQRAILRSYLGKGFFEIDNTSRANEELVYAKKLDPNDPTPWLYSALIKQQENRINEAIADLERSKDLNDNRMLYRSRLLLDQDRAVRSANLASLYRDAGLTDVALREAGRGVSADYANYSAHLFLAESYNALRDPQQVSLRYETPWLSEYLVANLLAPANAGALSPNVTQQDYARLFDHNRMGLVSATEYSSHGDWSQAAAQHGMFGSCAYAIDGSWARQNGYRPNSDFEQTTWTARVKQDLGSYDSLFLQGVYYESKSGDVAQYYDPNEAYPRLRVKESQQPLLLLGYHHEWSPGSHTLFLGGRFQDTLKVTNPDQPILVQVKDAPNDPIAGLPYPYLPMAQLDYQSDMEIYSAELQHICKSDRHATILGGRVQAGGLDVTSQLSASTPSHFAYNAGVTRAAYATDPVASNVTPGFGRASVYAYHQWQMFEPLQLTVGMSYDQVRYPENFRFSPLSDAEANVEQFSPKAGIIWSPTPNTALRASYTRSLGGMSFDQSFRLEPSQVAGINQAYRSLIPESLSGANAGERLETVGLGWDQKITTHTYLTVQADMLKAKAHRQVGALDLLGFPPVTGPSSTRENLDYEERNLTVILNQLIGSFWSLGTSYRLSASQLTDRQPDLPVFLNFDANQNLEAVLQQVNMFALFNHHSGFFGRFDTLWTHQAIVHGPPSHTSNDFFQLNLYLGYRFWQRRAELRASLLNLTDQDYRLDPINLTADLPRERTFALSLRLTF